jgi:hypothetical protein
MTDSLKQARRITTDTALKYHQRATNGNSPAADFDRRPITIRRIPITNPNQITPIQAKKTAGKARPFCLFFWLSRILLAIAGGQR